MKLKATPALLAEFASKPKSEEQLRKHIRHASPSHSDVSHSIAAGRGMPAAADSLKQIRIGASQGSSGLREELRNEATMSVVDPQLIRFEQRVKAGQPEINGIKFESLAWLQDLGR